MSRMARTLAALSLAVAIGGAPGLASAQPAAEIERGVVPPQQAAREHFDAGVTAARRGDWNTARLEFARAHELYPKASILLNLAGAQRNSGKYVAAAASYRALLQVGAGELTAAEREAARRALEETEEHVAHVRVTVENDEPGDRLSVDRSEHTDWSEAIQLDPGDHVAALVRDGEEKATIAFSLRDGEARTLQLIAPRRSAVLNEREGVDDRRRASSRSSSVFASPWFWVGVGVVVAGAAVTACIVAGCADGPSPYSGDLGSIAF